VHEKKPAETTNSSSPKIIAENKFESPLPPPLGANYLLKKKSIAESSEKLPDKVHTQESLPTNKERLHIFYI
jgi:hypothetical protein